MFHTPAHKQAAPVHATAPVSAPDIRVGDIILFQGAQFEVLTHERSTSHNEQGDERRPVYVNQARCLDPENFSGPAAYLEGGWNFQGNERSRFRKVVAASTSEELIFEFRYGKVLLEKYRSRSEQQARSRFESELPEWANELAAGDIKVSSRQPAY